MAYIKDYYLHENEASDQFFQVEDIVYSDFERVSGQLNFKICNKDYSRSFLSQLLADPRDYFDDGQFAKTYETITSIFIQTNQAPVIITDNRFEENIGTMGGVMHIMSPDFESTTGSATQPNIVIKGNSFKHNMAYFAGNVVYYGATKLSVFESNGTVEQLCGGGLLIDSNVFERNIGLKKHNGGAIALRCFKYYSSGDFFVSTKQTSLIKFDPSTQDLKEKVNVKDLLDSGLQHSVFRYQTHISSNEFVENHAGMGGSAIAADFYNQLVISDNLFKKNGPVTSYAEIDFSPYYKYFSSEQRPLTSNYIKD